jgi:hypothetical protein
MMRYSQRNPAMPPNDNPSDKYIDTYYPSEREKGPLAFSRLRGAKGSQRGMIGGSRMTPHQSTAQYGWPVISRALAIRYRRPGRERRVAIPSKRRCVCHVCHVCHVGFFGHRSSTPFSSPWAQEMAQTLYFVHRAMVSESPHGRRESENFGEF